MAKLTAADRAAVPKSEFGVPSKAPGPGSYPMPDKSHAANAKARAAGKPVEAQVDAKANKILYGSGGNPDNKLPQHAMHTRGRGRGFGRGGPGGGSPPGGADLA